MGRDWPVTLPRDAVDGLLCIFQNNRHVVSVGMDQRRIILHQPHMPFPEQQVTRLPHSTVHAVRCKGILLLITVTGARHATRQKRRLHQTGTIKPQP